MTSGRGGRGRLWETCGGIGVDAEEGPLFGALEGGDVFLEPVGSLDGEGVALDEHGVDGAEGKGFPAGEGDALDVVEADG